MIALVMPYYDRRPQLMKTLSTIRQSQCDDYRIVIVDDASPVPLTVPRQYKPVTIIHVKKEEKRWSNPEPVYNMGIRYAIREMGADKVILQNPECYHVGDVISHASENLNSGNYLVYSAFSINREQTQDENHDIDAIIRQNHRAAHCDGDSAWYVHPVLIPRALEFCAALTADSLIRLNGYDERLSDGMAYGDDFLQHRIKAMGLWVKIVEHPFVVHQYHYDLKQPDNRPDLMLKNRELYIKLRSEGQYRATHKYTPDI